jgi:hypothetical protein
MMTRIEVNLNPGILKWAREEAGFDFSEIVDKIDAPLERYKIWEKKGSNKIPAVCKHYKIRHMNLFEFFEDNDWQFSLSKKV